MILNVAEKPSVAKEVTNLLCQGPPMKLPSESIYNPVYCFDFAYHNQNVQMVFTSVTGHISNLEFLEKYKGWKSCDPGVLLTDAEVIKAYDPDKAPILKNLKHLASQASQLILWLDCDREGEAIAFDVLEVCKSVNPGLQVHRAHFSAVTRKEIFKAVKTLKQPDQNLANSVAARKELDLRIGAAITRYQGLTLVPVFNNLEGAKLSYGPCQFPTLGFVVDRFKEIQSFIVEPFYYIALRAKGVDFHWERNHLFCEYSTYLLYEKALESGKAKMIEKKQTEKSKLRPFPLNTIEMQKMATKKLNMSSHKVMEIAEKLYNKGFISYPRTETDSYPNSLNLTELITLQTASQNWGQYANKLLSQKRPPPRHGSHDDKAHPPIVPTKLLTNTNDFTNEELKVYELVTRHFLASVSNDAKGLETSVMVAVGTEEFKAKGLFIKEENFLEVYGKYERWNASLLPEFLDNEELDLERFEVASGKTSPPNYLTETDLITQMDKNGIGTDATIHEHIEKIQNRKYAIKANGLFKPTSLGLALVNAYEDLGFDLAKPYLRAKMEKMMGLVANGQLEKEQMIQACLNEIYGIYREMVAKQNLFIDTVRKYYQPQGVTSTTALGKCKTCGGQLDLRNDSEASLSCGKCKYIYKLPDNCDFSISGQTCQACGSDMLTAESAHKKQLICPCCSRKNNYSQSKGSWKNPATTHKVCKCPSCKMGDLEIRVSRQGKVYLGCSYFPKCKAVAYMPESVKGVKPTEIPCEKCRTKNVHAFLYSFEFAPGQALPDFAKSVRNICVVPFCDTKLYSAGYRMKFEGTSIAQEENPAFKQSKFRCFICSSSGHIASNCPGKNYKGVNIGNQNFINRVKGKKVCPECGTEGRHPKASGCSLAKRKKKDEYDEYVFLNQVE